MVGCSCPYRNGNGSNISELQFISSPREMPMVATTPTPPFAGVRDGTIPLSEIRHIFDQTAVIDRWGYRNRGLPQKEYEALLDSGANRTYASILRDIVDNALVNIRYRYGYFYAQGSGNFLLLSEAPDLNHSGNLLDEGVRTLLFKRSLVFPYHNITDYFRQVSETSLIPAKTLVSSGSEGLDIAPMVVFSLGDVVNDTLQTLLDTHDYKGYYLYHIIFSNLSNGICGYISDIIRRELGLGSGDGAGTYHVFSESRYTRGDDLSIVVDMLGGEGLLTPPVESRGVSEPYKESLFSKNYAQGFIFTHHPSSIDLLRG